MVSFLRSVLFLVGVLYLTNTWLSWAQVSNIQSRLELDWTASGSKKSSAFIFTSLAFLPIKSFLPFPNVFGYQFTFLNNCCCFQSRKVLFQVRKKIWKRKGKLVREKQMANSHYDETPNWITLKRTEKKEVPVLHNVRQHGKLCKDSFDILFFKFGYFVFHSANISMICLNRMLLKKRKE